MIYSMLILFAEVTDNTSDCKILISLLQGGGFQFTAQNRHWN